MCGIFNKVSRSVTAEDAVLPERPSEEGHVCYVTREPDKEGFPPQ